MELLKPLFIKVSIYKNSYLLNIKLTFKSEFSQLQPYK